MAIGESGKVGGENPYSDESRKNDLVLDSDHASNSEEILGLEEMEELLIPIENLTISGGDRVSALRDCGYKDYIMALPNELLVFIFDLLRPDLRELRVLLQVCKRFRKIFLSFPLLWEHQVLKPSLSAYTIDSIAKRSGTYGLRAILNSIPGADHTIYRHCKRWASLSLHFPEPPNRELQRLQVLVPCAGLASLKTLILDGLRAAVEKTWYFDPTWIPPSLQILNCNSLTPRNFNASTLSECVFRYFYLLPISDLKRFLSTATSLERLTIELDDIEYMGSNSLPNTTLPTLKHLSLRLEDVEKSIVEGLFESFSFPNLTSLHTRIGLRDIRDEDIDYYCFSVPLKDIEYRYPALETIHLDYRPMRSSGLEVRFPAVVIQDILENLPSRNKALVLILPHARLRAHNLTDLGVGLPENTCSVDIAFCNKLGVRFFDDLVVLFEDYGIMFDEEGVQNGSREKIVGRDAQRPTVEIPVHVSCIACYFGMKSDE